MTTAFAGQVIVDRGPYFGSAAEGGERNACSGKTPDAIKTAPSHLT
jgi:hypothetical protein